MLETPFRFQPTRLEQPSMEIVNLVAEITSEVEKLGSKLHPQTASSLSRSRLNYELLYTNLIEGHKTKPRDIERALMNDIDNDKNIAVRQFEAIRHTVMQNVVDEFANDPRFLNSAKMSVLRTLHEAFYHDAPQEMLLISGNGKEFKMIAGQFRQAGEPDVSVGMHVPPSSQVVNDFMQNFAQQFDFTKLNRAEKIIAIPAAHHRFNYIHPFHDGNGRVSRLMSHAMFHSAGLAAHGLWSISRG